MTSQEEQRRELSRCIQRALAGPEQKVLRTWLRQTAFGASYMPGREAEKVAWLEGKRALAAFMLKEGGCDE
jgi:hypothetical protein